MVSRETSLPLAASVFGPAFADAQRYVALLTTTAVRRGLLGPREVPRIWERHLLNCAVVAPGVPFAAEVCDVGSGAGLPGLVWALLRPDLRITLLEPSLRRASFLSEVVQILELSAVSVVRGRADGRAGRSAYDVVTARAVAPLERLATWTLPMCRPGGQLLALKGAAAVSELAAAEDTLRRLGAVSWGITQWGAEVLADPTTVVQVRYGGRTHG